MIISHVRLFMIISHVKIIAFQLSLFCKNYRFSKTVLYIINRIIHGCLEIPYLFLVLNMISHSFAALTREISCSTLEINLVFPRTHVLFSIYHIYFLYILYNLQHKLLSYLIVQHKNLNKSVCVSTVHYMCSAEYIIIESSRQKLCLQFSNSESL